MDREFVRVSAFWSLQVRVCKCVCVCVDECMSRRHGVFMSIYMSSRVCELLSASVSVCLCERLRVIKVKRSSTS